MPTVRWALMLAALTACTATAPMASTVPTTTVRATEPAAAASTGPPTIARTSASAPPAPASPLLPAPPQPSGPASAGAVPAVGILLIKDRGLFRYDGSTGSLAAIAPDRTGGFTLELALGAYLADPRCAGTCDPSIFVAWDGSTKPHGCRGSVSLAGACARIDAGALLIRSASGGAERTVLPSDWGAVSAEWDPDGHRLLLFRAPGANARSVWLMEADGRLRELFSWIGVGFPGDLTALGWSPDGRFVDVRRSSPPLHGGLYESITVIDATTLGVTSVVGGGAPRGEASWSGDQLVVGIDAGVGQDWSRTIRIWTPRKVTDMTALCPARAFAWNAVATTIAWVEPDCASTTQFEVGAGKRLVLADLTGRRTEVEFSGKDVFGARWSGDGRSLLAAVSDRAVQQGWEIWLVDAETLTATRLVSGLEWPSYSDVIGRDELMPMTTSGSALGRVAWSRAARP